MRNRTGTPCLGIPLKDGRYAQGTFIDYVAFHDWAHGFRGSAILSPDSPDIDPEIIPNRSEGIDQEGRLRRPTIAIPTRPRLRVWTGSRPGHLRGDPMVSLSR